MSLINEALKKAQHLRQDPNQAAAAPDAAHPGAGSPEPGEAPALRRGRPAINPALVAAVAIGVGLVAIAISLVVIFAGRGGEDAGSLTVVDAGAVEPAAPTTRDSAPVSGDPARITPAPSEPVVDVVAPVLQISPEPAAPEAASGPPSGSADAEPPPEPTAMAGASQPNPEVYAFIDQARVAGIRASATDPKVLMNERVYRLNDVVDRALQLRIIGIEPNELTFTDPSGHVYTKTF